MKPPAAPAPAPAPAFTLPPEQGLYARWLEHGTRVGLLVLLLVFILYLLGLWPALVPPQQLPRLWGLSAAQFQQVSGLSAGWGWLQQVGHGDVASLLGIVVLTGCSVLSLAVLARAYALRGDRLYAALCAAEIGVIALAASGVLNAGH
jgi:hypothetical protein